jgi:DNA-binding MarR family transcriptional regulator
MAKSVKASAERPSEAVTSAWARMVRVQQGLLESVEADLKTAGFPPLAWYDALLELSRSEHGHMRPVELQDHMLLPQYSMSRLIDRMSEAGYVERMTCPIDGRGQFVGITAKGRSLQKKMWDAYSAAIQKHVGTKLSCSEAQTLWRLLGKLS